MNDERLYKIRRESGGYVERTYEELCHELEFVPSAHFVEIEQDGTIGFTIGKPDEIRHLLFMIRQMGYVPSKEMMETAHQLHFR